MAIYQRDYYGRSKYGGRTLLEMAVDPFIATISGFDTVGLTWQQPGGTWSGFRLLRNRAGVPTHEDDGELLLDYPPGYSGVITTRYVDTNREGGWHYYAIYLYNDLSAEWERASTVDALVPFYFGSGDLMWDLLPGYYREVRDDGVSFNPDSHRASSAIYLNNEDVKDNMDLAHFLEVLGWGADFLRTQADLVRDGYNIDTVHSSRLELLAEQFGTPIEETAPASAHRSLVRNLGLLYRKRGTLDGIREMVSLTTGWPTDVTLGPNLMLSEDQSNFIHPQPEDWDEFTRYQVDDRVAYGKNLFIATQKSIGKAPPLTRTSNTWWDVSRYVEPWDDVSLARTDTGDVYTWQIAGPGGFVSGGTFIGMGAVDPEDELNYTGNALGFKNKTGSDGNFTLRSIPRAAVDMTSWDKNLVITAGIPVPRARHKWVEGKRYRAGDLVLFQGGTYVALESTDTDPTDYETWDRLGYDDRPRLAVSWWAHGPFNGTVNTGGLRENAVITEFDDNGNFINDTVCTPESFANLFWDNFHVVQDGVVNNSRAASFGGSWSSSGVTDWIVLRDDEGAYARPPTSGRSYQLAGPTVADGNVAVTFRETPTNGRQIGIVFRWASDSSFWIAAQDGLYKVSGGVKTLMFSYPEPFESGDRMRVNMNGNLINVYKNEVAMGAQTDSMNSTSTRHGIIVEA